jgi:AraC family transcriptional regulator, regulatory protein of adaptative response / DNA-3-methyladenine glycosylase II
MRVLGAPDVLLTGDVAMRKGAANLGIPSKPEELKTYANKWRPWRSYAGMHLWSAS